MKYKSLSDYKTNYQIRRNLKLAKFCLNYFQIIPLINFNPLKLFNQLHQVKFFKYFDFYPRKIILNETLIVKV